MEQARVRTTLALPAELLAAVDQAVCAGETRSRNQFVAEALQHELAARERAAIDADIAEMARDPEYQAECDLIMAEFAKADWEAFLVGEAELNAEEATAGEAVQ